MKRLVVCCDGTWSTLANKYPTNVALTARSVASDDADGNPQIVYYDDGVGVDVGRTSIIEAAFGEGLDYKMLEAYEFLTLNYAPGDQIYLFGYSRGAYTVRSLAGLVRKCGVLKRRHAHRAREALALYRNRALAVDSPEAQEFRQAYAAAWPKLDASGLNTIMGQGAASSAYDLRIRFLGVWDTVGALGIPRTAPFANSVNKKYEFHDLALSRAVLSARQAVAIDERRNPFQPTLWSNLAAFNQPGQPARVTQMWFPGDHGGVGGGCASMALSGAALLWMVEGAQACGLMFERGEGSILAGVEAEVDVINGPTRDLNSNGLINFLLGQSWRKGLNAFEYAHPHACRRWCENRKYRPQPLRRFESVLRDWLERNGA
ncbi:MAG: DUF2235 domain-containing protein [Hyphomonadaceae bacterium]